MEQIINYLGVERFNMFELILYCTFVLGLTFWMFVSAIKENNRKKKKAQQVILDEMHKIAMKDPVSFEDVHPNEEHKTVTVCQNIPAPADKEECKNALSYLENLNINVSSDGKA